MQVFRTLAGLPAAARGGVVALGNFDGVHKGHQAVLGIAGAQARDFGAALGVLTFEPHPRSFFNPGEAPFRLTPWRAKLRQLEAVGVDVIYQLRFDKALSQVTADAFVRDMLARDLGARAIVVGEDFCFGQGRQGDGALLQRLGGELGFEVTLVAPAGDDAVYSSSRVRRLLRTGDAAGAAALLGRPWEIEGRVIKGDQRGRTIGFATANLTLGDSLRPAYGVYAVRAGLDDGTWHDGVANLGVRPTVDGTREMLEVHVLDGAPDLYGRRLRVRLIDFVRPEQRFDGLEALKAQIGRDCGAAREALKATP